MMNTYGTFPAMQVPRLSCENVGGTFLWETRIRVGRTVAGAARSGVPPVSPAAAASSQTAELSLHAPAAGEEGAFATSVSLYLLHPFTFTNRSIIRRIKSVELFSI